MPYLKERVDYQLTRYPRLYLAVDRYSPGINWDKRVYLSFIRRGDTVLDVGANVGAHTVFFSHLVRANGRVLAFEPVPENLVLLEETIRRRSRFFNACVFGCAVGNPPAGAKEAVIRAPATDSTQASLAVHNSGSWEASSQLREYTVQLTSLDANESVQALPRIDFVKIDVEGGELDVLKGGARTLARHHPLIYCEMFEHWMQSFGYTPSDVFDFARTLGYSGARVIVNGQVHRFALSGSTPAGLFASSADVLLFGERHRAVVDDFDRRYQLETVQAPTSQN